MRHLGWFGAGALLLAACAAGNGSQLAQVSTLQTSSAPTVLHPSAQDTSQPVATTTPNGSNTPKPSTAPSAGPILSVTSVGKNPCAIALDKNGNAWIANFGSDTVSELSPAGKTLATYAVGHQPKALAVAPSGDVWVSDYGANAVTEIGSGRVLRQVNVGQKPVGIATDGLLGHIWVANSGSATVTKLSNTGGVLGTYNVGTDANSQPMGLVTDDNGTVWVACAHGGLFGMDQSGHLTVGNQLGNRSPRTIVRDATGNFWITFDAPDDHTFAELDNRGVTLSTPAPVIAENGVVGPGGVDSKGDFWSANTPYATDAAGNLAPTATTADIVSMLGSDGRVLGWYEAGDAYAAAVDATDVVWVLNYQAGTVTRLSVPARGS
ncbi:MAG TPA: hypothetical protein V6D47_21740 [Oscillatoriaceae cyanobacterium]